MKTWTRAATPTYCGRCEHRLLEIGDPLLLMTIGKLQFVRCDRCEGPAPPDLPAVVVRQLPEQGAPVRLAGLLPMDYPVQRRQAPRVLAALEQGSGAQRAPLDFKARATGEREPGEEG